MVAQYQYSQTPPKVYNWKDCYNVAMLYKHSVRINPEKTIAKSPKRCNKGWLSIGELSTGVTARCTVGILCSESHSATSAKRWNSFMFRSKPLKKTISCFLTFSFATISIYKPRIQNRHWPYFLVLEAVLMLLFVPLSGIFQVLVCSTPHLGLDDESLVRDLQDFYKSVSAIRVGGCATVSLHPFITLLRHIRNLLHGA